MSWISYYKTEGLRASISFFFRLVHFSNNDSNNKSNAKVVPCKHTHHIANFLLVVVHLLKVNSFSVGSQSADVFAGNHKDVITLSTRKITKS